MGHVSIEMLDDEAACSVGLARKEAGLAIGGEDDDASPFNWSLAAIMHVTHDREAPELRDVLRRRIRWSWLRAWGWDGGGRAVSTLYGTTGKQQEAEDKGRSSHLKLFFVLDCPPPRATDRGNILQVKPLVHWTPSKGTA
jgi:hypothetical protein